MCSNVYNVKIDMMYRQVYMCSRYIDQLHCLGASDPFQPAGALWHNSFSFNFSILSKYLKGWSQLCVCVCNTFWAGALTPIYSCQDLIYTTSTRDPVAKGRADSSWTKSLLHCFICLFNWLEFILSNKSLPALVPEWGDTWWRWAAQGETS